MSKPKTKSARAHKLTEAEKTLARRLESACFSHVDGEALHAYLLEAGPLSTARGLDETLQYSDLINSNDATYGTNDEIAEVRTAIDAHAKLFRRSPSCKLGLIRGDTPNVYGTADLFNRLKAYVKSPLADDAMQIILRKINIPRLVLCDEHGQNESMFDNVDDVIPAATGRPVTCQARTNWRKFVHLRGCRKRCQDPVSRGAWRIRPTDRSLFRSPSLFGLCRPARRVGP